MGFSIRPKTEETTSPPKLELPISAGSEMHSPEQQSLLRMDQQTARPREMQEVIPSQKNESRRLNQESKKAGTEKSLKERIEALRAESEERKEENRSTAGHHQRRKDTTEAESDERIWNADQNVKAAVGHEAQFGREKEEHLSEMIPLIARIQELEEIIDAQDNLIRERDREIAEHEDKAWQMDKLYHFRLSMAKQRMEEALAKEREVELLVPNAEENAARKAREEAERRMDAERSVAQSRERRYRAWLIGAIGYGALVTWLAVMGSPGF